MDTKLNEKNYLKKIGPKGIEHALNKPFSDKNCGAYLSEIGAIISLIKKTPSKILDIGCGTGWTSIFYAKRGHDVTGIDISEDMIDCAEINKIKSGLSNVKFLVHDYEEITYNEYFDCVVSFDSLHHAMDEKKVIKNAYAALKPGGLFIISEPGIFHNKTTDSKKAMSDYGVNEKSLPPKLTIKYGREVGFKKSHIFPKAEYLNWLLYPKNKNLPNINILRRALSFPIVRIFASIFLIVFYKRYDGIVVLEK